MAVRQTDSQLLAWANQDEQRQAEFDRKCDAAPRCDGCGGSVYPFDTFVKIGTQCYCKECVADGTRFTAELEV